MHGHLKRQSSKILRALVPCALTISILLNILSIWRLQPASVDNRQHTYIDDDYPTELPLSLDTVALTFESSEHYNISGATAWSEWNSLDYFPKGHGFVRLGPDGRIFGISMFHQIHCLQMIRLAIINGPTDHSSHCLNFLRQAILCNADITLDPLINKGLGIDGLGVTHVCRDWSQVYAYVAENQEGPMWTEQKAT